MNTTLSTKKVVARKEYLDACKDHFEFGLIRKKDGKWEVDRKEATDLQISDEDVSILQKHCDRNFKIPIGEKHSYQAGKYEGDFYTVRFSVELAAILTKYDLWYED